MSRTSAGISETKSVWRQFSPFEIFALIVAGGSNAYYLFTLSDLLIPTQIALALTLPPGIILGGSQIYYTVKKNKKSTFAAETELETKHHEYWKAYSDYKVAYGSCVKAVSQKLSHKKAHQFLDLIIAHCEKLDSKSGTLLTKTAMSSSSFLEPSISSADPVLHGIITVGTPPQLDEDLSWRFLREKSSAKTKDNDASQCWGLYKIRSGLKDVPKLIIASYIPEGAFYLTYFFQQVGANFITALSVSSVLSVCAAPFLAYIINRPSKNKLAAIQNRVATYHQAAKDLQDKTEAVKAIEEKYNCLTVDFKSLVREIEKADIKILNDLAKTLKTFQESAAIKRKRALETKEAPTPRPSSALATQPSTGAIELTMFASSSSSNAIATTPLLPHGSGAINSAPDSNPNRSRCGIL